MGNRLALRPILLTLTAAVLALSQTGPPEARVPPRATPPRPWTLQEALRELASSPRDPYLHYVALQLARRENQVEWVASQIQTLRFGEAWRQAGRGREVDLFSLFTGALAVQESLQLDTMRGEAPRAPEGMGARGVRDRPGEAAHPTAAVGPRRRETVDVASLTGPAVKSHPWERMLSGRRPGVSALARCVPEDLYFVEFRSLTKLLEASEISDLWGTHLLTQTALEARTRRVAERLKRQLALETHPLTAPFYDLVVEEVALTGSDLFAREGSDVTLLFSLKQPEVFRARMDASLASAERSRPDARRATGEFLGVPYVALSSPDRELSVLSAYPAPNLHVRSNSKVAFERVLEAIRGERADGRPVPRLGESPEFAYVRTLFPRGAPEEDGFIYLSDPFIRHLVGPRLKLTERRRMICYNHLRMIGHASLLYRTEAGRAPDSLETLVRANCTPGRFGQGRLACPDGGVYSLSPDGMTGVCSRHGHAGWLTPCSEIPLQKVSGEEADEYEAFVRDYNRYWRTYFDPIAVRLEVTPHRYRLETLILPLIDNSVYTGMASALGGEPEPLDVLPAPRRNIFSVAVQLNQEPLLQSVATPGGAGPLEGLGLGPEGAAGLDWQALLAKGLAPQVALHVYDSSPAFDFNLPSFLGEMIGGLSGAAQARVGEASWLSFLVASLNAPVYVSVPVRDAEVVDRFLDQLDSVLAVAARQVGPGRAWNLDHGFYTFTSPRDARRAIRAYTLSLGPLRLRFFWARIGAALYLASKPFIIEDLIALDGLAAGGGARPAGEAGPPAHALVRIRPENWNEVLPDFRLGWAENGRDACLNNVSLLSSVARAFGGRGRTAPAGEAEAGIEERAERLHGVRFFCPEGGRYTLGADGGSVSCTVHGSPRLPRQPTAPAEDSELGRLLSRFAGMTATLTFLDDGLRAVVTVDRR